MKVAVYLAGEIHTDWRGELAAVVVRFAAQFGEWNGALHAGRALALGKRLITLHPQELDHALKEVDRAAVAVTRTTDQVAELLRHAFGDVTGPTRSSEPARTVGSAAPDSSLPWGRK